MTRRDYPDHDELWPEPGKESVKPPAEPTKEPKPVIFLRPAHDREPCDFIGKDRKPVYRHCSRCDAVFLGRWEAAPRSGTHYRRPLYEGGVFYYQAMRSSMSFACSCEAAKMNAPNLASPPDWYLKLRSDQGAPRIVKSLELIAFEEAVGERKKERDREHKKAEETPERREESPGDLKEQSEESGEGTPDDGDHESDRAGDDDFDPKESLDIDRALSDDEGDPFDV